MYLLIALGGAVLALTLAARWLEPRMAFFPDRGEDQTPRRFGVPFDAVTLQTSDGQQIHAWRMNAPSEKARILYFHGNGANLSNWAPILTGIVRRGYSVFAIDYRGYGLSTGTPTERGLNKDVDAAVASAWPPGARVPIVYWGRSLGASMAAYAATVSRPDGVIIEAGFPSARTIVRGSPLLRLLSLFASYRFPVQDYLNRAGAPVLVMHGDRDSVVPFALGRELYDSLTAPKTFVTIHGGDHNDGAAPDAGAYWNAVDAFVQQLPGRRL